MKYRINKIKELKEFYSFKEKVIFLVGNKNDLEVEREISKEEGVQLSKKYGVMFSECSAKTGENVDFIFDELIKEEKKRREIEEKKQKEIKEQEENKRREIEEQERWKIEEEKAKKNLKILNKYLSF